MTTSPEFRFVSLERSAEQLTTRVEATVTVTWDDIMKTYERLTDEYAPTSPRAARMKCGPGVADWLKDALPTIKDSSSPFGVAQFAGITIYEDDTLVPGQYKIIDQYGNVMREGTTAIRGSVADWYLNGGSR